MRSLLALLGLAGLVAACSDHQTAPRPVADLNAIGLPDGCPSKFDLVAVTALNPIRGITNLIHLDANQDGFVCRLSPWIKGEHGPEVVIDNRGPLTPPVAVQIVEIHYDNDGTDLGEAVEIAGPAGMSLTGWTVWLYNGSGGLPYDQKALSGSIPRTCGAAGVVVLEYPTNGIQNGSPDGIALVDPSGLVVEFLSYEGTFTAASSGPAGGLTSTDIGVFEDSSTPIGFSLQRGSDDIWRGPAAETFGECN